MNTKKQSRGAGGVITDDPPAEKHSIEEHKAAEDHRVNLILSGAVYGDLSAMAKDRRTTRTEIIRLALGLIKIVIHEAKQGHKLVVANANGQVLKELILPG